MQDLESLFKRNLPTDIDFASLRFVEETTDILNLRKGNLEPLSESIDRGIMITVFKDGGLGYASTANISEHGIKDAIERARSWATHTANTSLFSTKQNPKQTGKSSLQKSSLPKTSLPKSSLQKNSIQKCSLQQKQT